MCFHWFSQKKNNFFHPVSVLLFFSFFFNVVLHFIILYLSLCMCRFLYVCSTNDKTRDGDIFFYIYMVAVYIYIFLVFFGLLFVMFFVSLLFLYDHIQCSQFTYDLFFLKKTNETKRKKNLHKKLDKISMVQIFVLSSFIGIFMLTIFTLIHMFRKNLFRSI